MSDVGHGRIQFDAPGAAISLLRWDGRASSTELVWSALTSTFAAERAGVLRDHVKLFVDGERILDSTSWPTDSEDVTTWRSSVSGDEADHAVFAFARGVQRCKPELMRVISELVGDHVNVVGLPRGHLEAEVFYGAYRNTPGGIHREGCTNMHLVLEGRKSMHFWRGTEWIPPGSPVRADVDPEERNPEEYLPDLSVSEVEKRGSVITAGPGEGYFWRSGIWHVGVTHEPSLALNIASYTKTLDEVATPFLPWASRVEGAVPRPWLTDYARHCEVPLDIERLMARLSGYGMRASPESSSPTHVPKCVRRISRAPLVWASQQSTSGVGVDARRRPRRGCLGPLVPSSRDEADAGMAGRSEICGHGHARFPRAPVLAARLCTSQILEEIP